MQTTPSFYRQPLGKVWERPGWLSWGPKQRPTETLYTSKQYSIEGFKGALDWTNIIPRGVSLSDAYSKYSSVDW